MHWMHITESHFTPETKVVALDPCQESFKRATLLRLCESSSAITLAPVRSTTIRCYFDELT